MIMNTSSLAEQIIPSACPSIQYRIHREIFRDSTVLPVMRKLQDQVLKEETVVKVTNLQAQDGWLASNFHSYESMESGIRLLCEKGVETDHPVLAHALTALENGTDRLKHGLGRPGTILDDLGFGGGETIRAYLFALAGLEEQDFVKDQIQQALDVFEFTAQVGSLREIHERHENQLVFRPSIRWPSIYHLRLLAWTKNWRTPDNIKMLVEAIRNLVRLSPIPDIQVKYKAQLIAPASFCMHHFAPDMNYLSDSEWMQWFHRMEVLSRLGVVHKIPELELQVHELEDRLLKDRGLFTAKLNHPYFQKWGAYTGLALEKDWRSPRRRINDLTFRSYLILNYSGI